MRPIQIEELKDLTSYELVRAQLRRAMIDLRGRRRLAVGPKISLVFENRDTVLYQIQEMIRAERIVDPIALSHELETYNELLPRGLGLAGTMFIEMTDSTRIREDLEAFLGLDREAHVWFDFGELGKSVARFSEGQSDEGRIASVHYVQFPFTADQVAAFRDPARPVQFVIDHDGYKARIPVEGEPRRSLIEDLEEA
jgi:hypothetical protein